MLKDIILDARDSAVQKPWEKSMTWAISSQPGCVIAILEIGQGGHKYDWKSNTWSEKLCQVGQQSRLFSTVGVGGDEDTWLTCSVRHNHSFVDKHTYVLVDFQTLPNKLNLNIRILGDSGKSLLDTLHLLWDSTQNAFLLSVEHVKATLYSNLTKSNKDSAHGLEIEHLVTTEY